MAATSDRFTHPDFLVETEWLASHLGQPNLMNPDALFIGRNLTPDNETGLGTWTREQIVAASQTGVRPDGRVLSPIMP